MESWDDENFEPASVTPAVPIANKWEGEDEDDEVKENWEDEDEEKEQPEHKTDEVKQPKKKSIPQIIAEKERLRREQMEKKLREQQEEELSPEERLRMQKESDLKIALDTTFGDTTTNTTNLEIDGLSLPNTKEEFAEFTEALSKKLIPLSKNIEYPTFTENLLRNLCATMSSLDIKKIKNTLDNLYLEKQKIEKGDKSKKNKGKGKAKLKIDDGNPLSAYVVDDYNNDYDDFM